MPADRRLKRGRRPLRLLSRRAAGRVFPAARRSAAPAGEDRAAWRGVSPAALEEAPASRPGLKACPAARVLPPVPVWRVQVLPLAQAARGLPALRADSAAMWISAASDPPAAQASLALDLPAAGGGRRPLRLLKNCAAGRVLKALEPFTGTTLGEGLRRGLMPRAVSRGFPALRPRPSWSLAPQARPAARAGFQAFGIFGVSASRPAPGVLAARSAPEP